MAVDQDGTRTRQAPAAATDLMAAILELAGDLDLPRVLERFVAVSTALTGARFGAINIVDDDDVSTTFVQSGVDERTVALLGRPPHAQGVLGAIPDEGVLRLDDLTHHPAFRGLPKGHPPMGSFLGTAVRVRGERYGTLYLAEKDGGFDAADETVVLALAAAAAVAVQNAQLYDLEVRRRRWQAAAQEISTLLLEGADAEDVLERIAAAAREIGDAHVAALVLPAPDGSDLVVEIVTDAGRHLLGLTVSDDPHVHGVYERGDGLLLGSVGATAHPFLAGAGPALLAPMHAHGHGVGVLVLLREPGTDPFTDDDLVLAQTFARQAALAFVLAEAQRLAGQAALHDERTRIARDLHDLAIQQLFAAGMQVEALRGGTDDLPPAASTALEQVVAHVDAGIRQIRVIVRTLDDPGAAIPLVQRVVAEVEMARSSLGFAPTLQVRVDDVALDPRDVDRDTERRVDELVAPGRADTVVAVVREGLSNVARHARSRAVDVRLAVTSGAPGRVVVEVEDDGVGVPPAPTRTSGTRNLAMRAQEVGGSFQLGSGPSGRGALLRWSAPLD